MEEELKKEKLNKKIEELRDKRRPKPTKKQIEEFKKGPNTDVESNNYLIILEQVSKMIESAKFSPEQIAHLGEDLKLIAYSQISLGYSNHLGAKVEQFINERCVLKEKKNDSNIQKIETDKKPERKEGDIEEIITDGAPNT